METGDCRHVGPAVSQILERDKAECNGLTCYRYSFPELCLEDGGGEESC